MAALTIVETIVAAHSADGLAQAGAIASVRPDILMLNDVSGPLAFRRSRERRFERTRPLLARPASAS